MAETCRQRLMREHPKRISGIFNAGCYGCPSQYGYLDDPDFCDERDDWDSCTECWDRVIPDTKEKEKDMTGVKETQCTRCIHREVCSFKKDFLLAQEVVDNAVYKLDIDGNGVYIGDIPFLYPVELKCKYYVPDGSNKLR